MHVVTIPFRSLTIWALVILQDVADTAGAEPVVPTPDLRLALAWLRAVRPEESVALNLFWDDAVHIVPMENAHSRAYVRSLALGQRVSGLAIRLRVGSELLGETRRRWKQGLFDGADAAPSHDYLTQRIKAYREEQERRDALY